MELVATSSCSLCLREIQRYLRASGLTRLRFIERWSFGWLGAGMGLFVYGVLLELCVFWQGQPDVFLTIWITPP